MRTNHNEHTGVDFLIHHGQRSFLFQEKQTRQGLSAAKECEGRQPVAMFGALIILRWKSAAFALCACWWRVTQQAGLSACRTTSTKKARTQGGLSTGISPDVTHTEGQKKEKGG